MARFIIADLTEPSSVAEQSQIAARKFTDIIARREAQAGQERRDAQGES
jgi:hypothetical protein